MKIRLFAILVAGTLGVGSVTAFAATMGVGSWHIWAGSQTLTKGTCTITSAASINDTYISESSSNSSFGSATTMLVRGDSGQRNWTFVRFDLSSCALPTTAGADSATLKLVVKKTANNTRTLTVTPVLQTWGETLTAVQANALTYGGSATTTFSAGGTNGATLSIPVTIDVDALIKNASANYGWRVTDDGSTASANTTTFDSSEATAALRPQLVINYEK